MCSEVRFLCRHSTFKFKPKQEMCHMCDTHAPGFPRRAKSPASGASVMLFFTRHLYRRSEPVPPSGAPRSRATRICNDPIHNFIASTLILVSRLPGLWTVQVLRPTKRRLSIDLRVVCVVENASHDVGQVVDHVHRSTLPRVWSRTCSYTHRATVPEDTPAEQTQPASVTRSSSDFPYRLPSCVPSTSSS